MIPHPASCRSRSFPAGAWLLACLPLWACAPPPTGTASGSGAVTALRRLLNADTGLEVRTWTVSDNPGRIAEALDRYGLGAVGDPDADAALRSNGLRAVRVRVDLLDALLSELGVAPVEVRAWHGQVLEWRQLLSSPVGPAGAVAAVGNGIRRLDPGRMLLMARCWTLPMEDGTSLNLELVPVLERPRTHDYARLLGDRTLSGEVFESMSVETQLAPGLACVLTGESPGRSGDAAEPPPHGPVAPAPATIGEILFEAGGEPPLRQLLVLVPRLPQRPGGQAPLAAGRQPAEDEARRAQTE